MATSSLHNRRITGDNMDNPFNRVLIEKWKNKDAIYATPIGSNDNCEWSSKIPIILIAGVATSTDAPTNVLTSCALQYLSTSMFFLKSPAERMDAIIEAVLVKNYVDFSVGHMVATFLRNYFLRQDGTMALVQQLSIEPLSFVLKILVDEGDNKRSWYEDLANLPEELINYVFELPSYRAYSVNRTKCYKSRSWTIRTIEAAGTMEISPNGKALDPELYNSGLSNHDCDNAKYKSLLSDYDKLFKLQKAEVTNQVIRKIRNWRYAAIKFRCLLLTNDEMRDHLFQLLGNDFFPKWKERHQVSSKVRCLIVLDKDIKEFLDLGEAVGSKSGGLDSFFAL
ncbi:putative protein SPA1-RELATED 3-like isoform X1 [Capsicum annuum]|nr:putative protein SPA1-RELATED 3-like isoform X1 [Capsicum annuum]